MKKCVICGVELTEQNKSKEHIIHNAIGGCLECDGIYCKTCNNQFGSNQDKAFVKTFAPILDRVNLHKSRKTKGTSYTGVVCDENGNIYTATYKSGKVVKMINANSEFVKYESGKYTALYHHFNIDNYDFKMGIAKIAFNYAISCDIEANCLEKVFNFSKKELVSTPIVIPYVPMTLFDTFMELHHVNRLFHVVRVFNCENYLYAYIELFNTFQFYVLLSEKYNFEQYGDIDRSCGNIIEAFELPNEDILKSVTPSDYKDLDIISKQYRINIDDLLGNLKEYHDYDCLDRSEKMNMLFENVGKLAYEQIRKQTYVVEYNELINNHYSSIDFTKLRHILLFGTVFNFYTIYDDDCVNMGRYKKVLPNGSYYPIAICELLLNSESIEWYGYSKFYMLESRLG